MTSALSLQNSVSLCLISFCSPNPNLPATPGLYLGQKEKMASEDEMARLHHQCNNHDLGQAPGYGEQREVWPAAAHEATKSWTQLGDQTTKTEVQYKECFVLLFIWQFFSDVI